MAMSRQCDSCAGEESVDEGSEASIADYLETIVILQDEVARLEQELQLHQEGHRETTSTAEAGLHDEATLVSARENVAGDPGEVERFKAELASRDETIRLLMDELVRVEEAQEATRAEWEQLSAWVAELEHRVEGHDAGADAGTRESTRIPAAEGRRITSEVRPESPRLGGTTADLSSGDQPTPGDAGPGRDHARGLWSP